MIREVAIEELPTLEPLASSFFAEGKLDGVFRMEKFTQRWTDLIRAGFGFILVSEADGRATGFLGGAIMPDGNTGDTVAMELFWYVLPGHRGSGLKLVKAFEDKATKAGAVRILMTHLESLNTEAMSALYQRMGYRKTEQIWTKVT